MRVDSRCSSHWTCQCVHRFASRPRPRKCWPLHPWPPFQTLCRSISAPCSPHTKLRWTMVMLTWELDCFKHSEIESTIYQVQTRTPKLIYQLQSLPCTTCRGLTFLFFCWIYTVIANNIYHAKQSMKITSWWPCSGIHDLPTITTIWVHMVWMVVYSVILRHSTLLTNEKELHD